tara:strand:- start:187 stop:432 length:246 start_codon:yes stop_codon:yes gene_type:complete
MKLYDLKTCENLINNYIEQFDGAYYQINEGSLGLGKIVLFNGIGRKSIIIEEVYLNESSSAHKIRMYNDLPKKYEKLIYQL